MEVHYRTRLVIGPDLIIEERPIFTAGPQLRSRIFGASPEIEKRVDLDLQLDLAVDRAVVVVFLYVKFRKFQHQEKQQSVL